ncbi:MAG: hypothetical protein NTY46_13065 [Candidatus Sumerlaeota bacterium]|nr:hypothetical protein [Candidatus Sumerlaeota bacterium]
MKKTVCCAVLAAAAFAAPVQSATLIKATFDVPLSATQEIYLPGATGDILGGAAYFQRSWSPVNPTLGWLDNQFSAPAIETPPTAGFQGGNALAGDSNEAGRTRQGYWIQINPALSSQDFTAEAIFYLKTYMPAYAEYKIQNIISTFWMSDNKSFEIRTMGDFGTNVLQLMTNDGAVEHNVTTANDTVAPDTWYHTAIVYTQATGVAEFYFNGSPAGSAPTGWGAPVIQWVCLAAWPNPAGSCRDISGAIDAFALSDAALTPGSFALPTNYSSVGRDWTLY